eukprot:CAMPEP_0176338812 /NCGR_PEP_ID=MMETSP0126-20121128/256_1 /TAXON_ID=141414 ORGANISM="Strombidinopsis acuminatum, Strain SPMC142" /NCGR_SAMPLE_ID=MMETSP0126 /ASSEMBLY_ACC=CAM_ASM_000229 /LENGTH=92 /DNA_ID=CAMNT_0017682011 /DNA_START=683 /DNA_END=961 /DNA_ORIENTATION=-
MYSDYWTIATEVYYNDTFILGGEAYPYAIDTGNRKIGFPSDLWPDFMFLMEQASDSIICDDITCYGREFDCSVYEKNLTDILKVIELDFYYI